jgi:hypothetical protein
MVEIFNYIENHSGNYGLRNESKQGVDKDLVRLRSKTINLEENKILNSKDLYYFYINLHQTNNILPVKKEIKKLTGLSDHNLRKLNDELKQQNLLKLLDNQKLQVIDFEDELNKKRIKKLEG